MGRRKSRGKMTAGNLAGFVVAAIAGWTLAGLIFDSPEQTPPRAP